MSWLPIALLLVLLNPASPPSLDAAKKQLAAAIKEDSRYEVEQAGLALLKLDSKEAIDVLINDGLLSDSPKVEEVIRDVLTQVNPKSPVVEHLCTECTLNANYVVRDQLTQVLAFVKTKSAYKAVLQSLYDKKQSVSMAALKALRLKGNLGAVPHLIRALKRQEDLGKQYATLAWEIKKTLESLTTYSFHTSARWQSFWNDHGIGFVKPTKREVREREERAKEGSGLTGVAKKPEFKVPTLFGEEVPSDRIVFVIDRSISMNVVDPAPADGSESKGSRMRIRRLQDELDKAISDLPKDAQFTVIAFSNKVSHLSKTLLDATSANKQRARKFLRGFNPDGETYTDEALEAAFKVRNARMFVVMSDGAPVRNRVVMDVNRILAWVNRTNRFRHIVIHAVGFYYARESIGDFLPRLAGENGGKYLELP